MNITDIYTIVSQTVTCVTQKTSNFWRGVLSVRDEYLALISEIAGISLIVPATFGILLLCRKCLPGKATNSSEPFWFGEMMNLFSVLCCVELVFSIYFFLIGNAHAEQFAKFIFAPTITLLGLKVIAGLIKDNKNNISHPTEKN